MGTLEEKIQYTRTAKRKIQNLLLTKNIDVSQTPLMEWADIIEELLNQRDKEIIRTYQALVLENYNKINISKIYQPIPISNKEVIPIERKRIKLLNNFIKEQSVISFPEY